MFDIELGHYLTYHHVTQNFFRRHGDKFDGLIIPLSVATVFRHGTGGFVLTLKKQYAIDPRTPIFQAEFERHNIRRSHEEMAVIHGRAVREVFYSRPLRPSDLDTAAINEASTGVLDFQKTFAEQSAEKVAKYAAILGEEVENNYAGPTFLIPPYFRSSSRNDPWYSVSLELARAAAGVKESYRLSPVVHITQSFPEEDFALVARDYLEDTFDGLIVYVNDLKEYVASRTTLGWYARLVQILKENGKPLFSLFGGYFTLVLRQIGLGCFSNAVGYGEYRDSGFHAGGQAMRRYYIPKLHRYFTDIEAQSLLDNVNQRWFRCTCNTCASRRRVTNLTSQELLDHFLNVRVQELQYVGNNGMDAVVAQMDETFTRLSRYPYIPLDRYEHLQEWSEALRPFC